MTKRAFVYTAIVAAVILAAILLSGRRGQQGGTYVCADCNVIVVAFDSLPASHVSAYGYQKPTTPNLDSFAKNAFLFENAVSPAPWTVPTYISWWTSMFPSEHKVVNRFSVYNPPVTEIANLRKLTPSAVTLAEVMKQHGYATAGFTGDAGARGAQGNNIGFDVYVDTPAGFNGFDESVPLALDWIRKNGNKKFFMFLHGYDSHGQYKPKEFTGKFLDAPYRGPFRGTVEEQAALREEGLAKGGLALSDQDVNFWRAWYDEKINAADKRFQSFIDGLKAAGVWDKTIVLVASDHGEEIYEHQGIDHGHTLYQELIHVPFLIRLPWIQTGRRISAQVSTLDIMPTVLDLTGIRPTIKLRAQMRGISLVPILTGRAISRKVFSETDYRLFTHKRSITTPNGWKFILTLAEVPDKRNVKELYNLRDDPGETVNLIDAKPLIARELESEVRRHMREMGTDPNGPWPIGCSAVYNDQCQQ